MPIKPIEQIRLLNKMLEGAENKRNGGYDTVDFFHKLVIEALIELEKRINNEHKTN